MSDVRDLGVRYVAAARPCDATCEHRHCAFSGEVKLVRDLLHELESQDAVISRLSRENKIGGDKLLECPCLYGLQSGKRQN